jgi:hypothetical protein
VRFGEPGRVEERAGVDGFTWTKREGRWRIVSLAFAGDRYLPRVIDKEVRA